MDYIDNFQLRNLEKEDLDIILKWRNSEYIKRFMFHDQTISKEEHYKWFNSVQHDVNVLKLFLYKNRPIGFVNITNIDKVNNICSWGFYIGERDAPSKSGTVMGILALDYIFYSLGSRKLCAEVMDYNIPSLNYHKKFGFQEEGILKKQIRKNNVLVDIHLFALFFEEWSFKRNNLKL